MSSTNPAGSPAPTLELPAELAGLCAGLDGHLVGGAVRDLICGRPVTDVDLVLAGDPRRPARVMAGRLGGSAFPLSERHGAWRVVGSGRTIDLAAQRGSLEHDLRQRDFTINAIALPLAGGAPIDPTGGRSDLERRLLRAVSERVFSDDPLRLLRLPRIAHELDFEIDPATLVLARADAGLAGRPAGERIYAEVLRMLSGADPAAALRLFDAVGALDPVLPELAALRGVEQSTYHHLDAWEHTLHVVDCVADVAGHPDHYLPAHAGVVAQALAAPVGDGLDRRLALRLAALFHDICKPQTRAVDPAGRVSFMGHDREGAEVAVAVLARWNAAGPVRDFCRLLVAEHLRLGFMIRRRPLDRRAAHRYARATRPHTVASIVLSLADRLATRGRRTRQAYLRRHAETASELIGLITDLCASPTPPLLRGDEIAAAAGVTGPAIGKLVEALAEEQAAGAVTTREQAVEFVRR